MVTCYVLGRGIIAIWVPVMARMEQGSGMGSWLGNGLGGMQYTYPSATTTTLPIQFQNRM